MATFIPGMTDVFPASGAFDLDFNRVERMLKLRESMYQQGAKKVKSLYDSIFSSAMLRDDNIEKRDAYLKTITESLNSVSALDFSLPQNQQIATSLFDPIVTDKTIVKDIAFTKNYMSEVSKAEALRTSSNNATRQTYWSLGRRALDYAAEEFKNADPTTALGMSSPKYVPQVDIQALADKMYKDAGISVKVDKITGAYIWTQKNGDVALPITQQYVNTLFSQDPGIQSMLSTQAYVERKDFVKQNAAIYGGEDKAEMYYLNNVIRKVGQDAQNQINSTEDGLALLRSKVDSWDKVIRTKGIVPDRNNPDYIKYLQDLKSLEIAEAAVSQMKSEVVSLNNVNFNSIEDMRMVADNYVRIANHDVLANQIAKNLAYKKAELTVKADPVSLAQLRSELQFEVQSKMETIRQINRIEALKKRKEFGLTGNNKKDKDEEEEENETNPSNEETVGDIKTGVNTGAGKK
jgi:hypothetical protein